jgi:cation diffusion facilitator family transporter
MSDGTKSARGDRAHRIALAGNGLLALAKMGSGSATGSQALFADGVHSLSDTVNGIVAWVGYRLGARPPDADHPYGHGNFEAIASLAVGIVLCGGGLGVAWAALASGEGVSDGLKGAAAIGTALASIAVKVWMTLVTRRVGWELASPSLIVVARDNASDVLTSLLVVIGVAVSLLGIPWAEPAAAVAIGGFVLALGFRSVWEGLGILSGRVSDPELPASLAEAAARVAGVRGVQRTRIQPVGSDLQVDMEISVDGSLRVVEGHEIAHAVARAVKGAHPRVVDVHVHVNPHLERPGERLRE